MNISKYYRRIQGTKLIVAFVAIFVQLFFLPNIHIYESEGNNIFHVTLNGLDCGYVDSETDVWELITEARKALSVYSPDVIYAKADLEITGSEVIFGEVNTDTEMIHNLTDALGAGVQNLGQNAFTVKIDDYSVNMSSMDDVLALLQAALDIYQTGKQFVAKVVLDPSREINALVAEVITNEEAMAEEREEIVRAAGFGDYLDKGMEASDVSDELKSFNDFEYGLQSLDFANNVEIAYAYLPGSQIMDVEQAIEEVTVTQEVNSIYTVQSGDSLSKIAEKVNIPMDKIIELNNTLDNEKSLIRVGDELIVTIPEPILSVNRTVLEYKEEIYDAPIEYIRNDSWYTSEQVTRQQPSAGFRNVAAQITYKNDLVQDKAIIKEEVLLAAVPKIVERGTRIPPTYIKPLSGGKMSSGFGGRRRPTSGASSYHQGLDWSTPTGTTIYASSGGTVVHAGWSGGYGYCVFINHPDGKQTRYAHLSKVLVSKGQSVSQGQVIARSGNTGVSSGPHLHFEIRVNGSPVNPLRYLN